MYEDFVEKVIIALAMLLLTGGAVVMWALAYVLISRAGCVS